VKEALISEDDADFINFVEVSLKIITSIGMLDD
jgi:hypothetical protein